MKNTKLRMLWIVPNVFCYLMLLGYSTFVYINAEGLREISKLSIWILAIVMLFFVSVFGSYRIWMWIRDGKM